MEEEGGLWSRNMWGVENGRRAEVRYFLRRRASCDLVAGELVDLILLLCNERLELVCD